MYWLLHVYTLYLPFVLTNMFARSVTKYRLVLTNNRTQTMLTWLLWDETMWCVSIATNQLVWCLTLYIECKYGNNCKYFCDHCKHLLLCERVFEGMHLLKQCLMNFPQNWGCNVKWKVTALSMVPHFPECAWFLCTST